MKMRWCIMRYFYTEIFLNSNLTGTASFSEAQIRTDGLKILAYNET